MKLSTAEKIEQAAQDLGLELDLREDYSGRGMFGKKTAGVVGGLGDIIKSIAHAATRLKEEEADDFVDDMDIAIDNMGRDIIIY